MAIKMEYTTIQINWLGPFSLSEVMNSEAGENCGIYLLTGKQRYERESSIQYCGITERPFKTRLANHHRVPDIARDLEIWLGTLSYPSSFSRDHLETAESAIIYFWQPSLNDRKKINPPRPTSIISHWFKKDGSPRINQKSIYKDLHDVLCWDGYNWRTGNLDVYTD